MLLSRLLSLSLAQCAEIHRVLPIDEGAHQGRLPDSKFTSKREATKNM